MNVGRFEYFLELSCHFSTLRKHAVMRYSHPSVSSSCFLVLPRVFIVLFFFYFLVYLFFFLSSFLFFFLFLFFPSSSFHLFFLPFSFLFFFLFILPFSLVSFFLLPFILFSLCSFFCRSSFYPSFSALSPSFHRLCMILRHHSIHYLPPPPGISFFLFLHAYILSFFIAHLESLFFATGGFS